MKKVSIITINYNSKKDLESTIISVVNQSYPNIEYIVIDGGSSDGSIEIIKKYEKYISYWVSEPDRGIYDAMNKGLDLASGFWINFKNSGDRFYDNDSLTSIDLNKYEKEGIDIVYGPSYNLYGNIIIDSLNVYNLDLGKLHLGRTMPPHQSSLFKFELFKKYRYPIEYKISSDFDFILKMYLDGRKIVFDSNLITLFKMGGVSTKNEILTVREKFLITKKYFPIQKIILNYTILLIEVYIKSIFKKSKFLYTIIIKFKSLVLLNEIKNENITSNSSNG